MTLHGVLVIVGSVLGVGVVMLLIFRNALQPPKSASGKPALPASGAAQPPEP